MYQPARLSLSHARLMSYEIHGDERSECDCTSLTFDLATTSPVICFSSSHRITSTFSYTFRIQQQLFSQKCHRLPDRNHWVPAGPHCRPLQTSSFPTPDYILRDPFDSTPPQALHHTISLSISFKTPRTATALRHHPIPTCRCGVPRIGAVPRSQ